MPVRVVDVFEAIEVHEQQRDRRLRAIRDGESLLRAVVEKETIRQTGERVVHRETTQLLIHLAALAYVAEERAERRTVGGADRRDGQFDREGDAILPQRVEIHPATQDRPLAGLQVVA